MDLIILHFCFLLTSNFITRKHESKLHKPKKQIPVFLLFLFNKILPIKNTYLFINCETLVRWQEEESGPQMRPHKTA